MQYRVESIDADAAPAENMRQVRQGERVCPGVDGPSRRSTKRGANQGGDWAGSLNDNFTGASLGTGKDTPTMAVLSRRMATGRLMRLP